MPENEILQMDLEHGILTLQGIRELLRMKKEGLKIDSVEWQPKVDNYIYVKCEEVEHLQKRVNECQEQLYEVLEIKKELLKHG